MRSKELLSVLDAGKSSDEPYQDYRGFQILICELNLGS